MWQLTSFFSVRYVVGEAGYGHLTKDIPENNALQGLAGALIEAWRLYNVPKSVILFLIEDVTYNICDQVKETLSRAMII